MVRVLIREERLAVEQALGETRRVREWRRYRAVLLWDEEQPVSAIARTLQVSMTSVYSWLAAWQRAGLAGLREGVHPGLAPRLDAVALAWVDGLLRQDPQDYGYTLTGWTIPALHSEETKAGYVVSSHTLRRAVGRLGWHWKRPTFVLGRPDPAYAEKKKR